VEFTPQRFYQAHWNAVNKSVNIGYVRRVDPTPPLQLGGEAVVQGNRAIEDNGRI